tara:strand:- start:480 stop:641 length:162 start_codon:yes stop_codon:yes gene_type:complete
VKKSIIRSGVVFDRKITDTTMAAVFTVLVVLWMILIAYALKIGDLNRLVSGID